MTLVLLMKLGLGRFGPGGKGLEGMVFFSSCFSFWVSQFFLVWLLDYGEVKKKKSWKWGSVFAALFS